MSGNKSILLLLSLIVVVSLSACSPSMERTVELSDNGRTVEVPVGGKLVVKLENNSLDNTWDYSFAAGGNDKLTMVQIGLPDPGILILVDTDYEMGTPKGNTITGAKDIWVYKALAAGTTKIYMDYHISTDVAGAKPVKQFVLNIKVVE